MPTAVLSAERYHELSSSHPLTGLDLPEEIDGGYWIGWVPVVWPNEDGSYNVVYDVEECDDYREVGPFLSSSREEAEAHVRAVYGPLADVDPV